MGRRIWAINKTDYAPTHAVGPWEVLSLRAIFPAGTTDGGVDRKRSLIQVYTDPGGRRTLAVADIWSKDPGKADRPW